MKFEKFFPDLSFAGFAIIVDQSLNRSQLIRFCTRSGLEVPGYRLDKIPTPELIRFLYADCRDVSGLVADLEKLLDKTNRKIEGTFENGGIAGVKKKFKYWGEMLDEGRLGPYLWAAFRDSRTTVNRLATQICRDFDKMIKRVSPPSQQGKQAEDEPPQPELSFPEEEVKEKIPDDDAHDQDIGELLKGIRRIKDLWEEELKSLEKRLKKLAAEARKATGRAEKRRNEIREREGRIVALRKKLKEWKVRCQALEKSVAAKKSPPDDSRLRSRLSSLERELRKREYELRKNEEKLKKVNTLEDELRKAGASLRQLRAEAEQSRKRDKNLREELEASREKIKALKTVRKPAPVKTPPPGEDRLGIFLDSRNIYHSVAAIFAGGRVDFGELYTRIARGRKVVRAIAYVIQADFADKEGFFNMLKFKGFQVKRRPLKIRADRSMKGNWDMGMALDLIKYAEDLDTIALVSGDGDFNDLVLYLKKKGVKVEVYGVETSTALDLKGSADLYLPIDANWLLPQ